MQTDCDVLVIGGGPAGMAAATTAANLGLRTRLLDEQPAPGGQIYRGITTVAASLAQRLGDDYTHGRKLSDALATSKVEVEPEAAVFDIDSDLNVAYLRDGEAHEIAARHLILATGAIERAAPVPGWTLPGVMYVGAAQLMLKAAASVPSGRVAIAGNGPLLLLAASQLVDAGADVVALVETTAFVDMLRAVSYLPRALGAREYLLKGLAMMRALRRRRIRWIRGATALTILGGQRAEALQVAVGNRLEHIPADTVLLHFGVIPNTQITRLMRLEHIFDASQEAWRPRVDRWGRSSHPGVGIAGDGAGIGGALAAEASGTLAALDAAAALGHIGNEERDRRGIRATRERARQLRIRPFLDAMYRPPAWIMNPGDETIVCRCEEVTAGEIRAMTKLGCRGPNQTKFFSRCGMGPCQGRVCGPVVAAILGTEISLAPEAVGQYRIRPPLKPVPLSALAALDRAVDTREPDETT